MAVLSGLPAFAMTIGIHRANHRLRYRLTPGGGNLFNAIGDDIALVVQVRRAEIMRPIKLRRSRHFQNAVRYPVALGCSFAHHRADNIANKLSQPASNAIIGASRKPVNAHNSDLAWQRCAKFIMPSFARMTSLNAGLPLMSPVQKNFRGGAANTSIARARAHRAGFGMPRRDLILSIRSASVGCARRVKGRLKRSTPANRRQSKTRRML